MIQEAVFFYFTITVPIFTLAIQIFYRESAQKIIRIVFWLTVILISGYLVYLSVLQYQAFEQGPIGLTLGTISGFKWFFGYVRFHFWNQYLISFLAALGIFALAKYMNKKRGEIFFEPEEIYLGGLGTFLVGYPGFFFYLPLTLLSSAAVAEIFLQKGERLPLYYFWIPTALFVLLAVHFWLGNQEWWTTFRF